MSFFRGFKRATGMTQEKAKAKAKGIESLSCALPPAP
jgi:hypothetical protein